MSGSSGPMTGKLSCRFCVAVLSTVGQVMWAVSMCNCCTLQIVDTGISSLLVVEGASCPGEAQEVGF